MGILQSNLDIGPEITERFTGIVMRTLEKVPKKRSRLARKMESIGELQLPSRIRRYLSDKVPDSRFEEITAEYPDSRGRSITWRLLNKCGDADGADRGRNPIGVDADNSVAFDVSRVDFTDGYDASAMLFARPEQLTGDRDFTEHDYIGKKNGKSFLTYQRPRARNGMGETKRPFLLDIEDLRQACKVANKFSRRCVLAGL